MPCIHSTVSCVRCDCKPITPHRQPWRCQQPAKSADILGHSLSSYSTVHHCRASYQYYPFIKYIIYSAGARLLNVSYFDIVSKKAADILEVNILVYVVAYRYVSCNSIRRVSKVVAQRLALVMILPKYVLICSLGGLASTSV